MKNLNKTLCYFTLLLTLIFCQTFYAQTPEEIKKLDELLSQKNYFEAIPILEKVVANQPDNAEMQKYLGFGYLSKVATVKTEEEQKSFRVKARNALIKARDLGINDLQIEGLIDSIPLDGSKKGKFSFIKEAEDLMNEAESFFAQSKYDEALAKYQKALEIDPKIYYAALFCGDAYLQKGKFDQAEIWYQKAIAINPYIETAYRYSATPLMRQEKYKEARDRYIEAYITQPYSKLSVSGLVNWGQVTRTRLGHPKIDIPETKTGEDGKQTTTINVNPLVDDGSMAWIAYSATREIWKKEKFAKTFPNERTYRHSLEEEVDALRSVVKMANELKGKNAKLNEQFVVLGKLDSEGLLESFILLAKADNDIAQQHFGYLKKNREKLRQYVLKYVIGEK